MICISEIRMELWEELSAIRARGGLMSYQAGDYFEEKMMQTSISLVPVA
jgi:hypothetical protein